MLCIIVIFFITISTIIFYIIYRNHSHLNNIPMPPSNLFLGHILDFKDPTQVLKTMTNYMIKFGGILRIYIPPHKPSLLITDNKIVEYILNSHQTLEKSKDYNFLKVWLGTGLLTAGVSKWKIRRRMLTPCLGRLTLLKHFIEVLHSLEKVLIGKLNEEIDNDSIDVFSLIKMFSLDVVCETSMGVSINAQEKFDEQYVKSIGQMCRIIISRMSTPYKRFDFLFRFTKDYRKQQDALKVINEFLDDIIERKTKTMPTVEMVENDDKFRLALLDLLMLRIKTDSLTFSDLKEEVNTILFGGHETTATGIAFTLYALAQHQEIQEKVVEEQKNILNGLKYDAVLSYSDLQEMKYLDLVINEALRLYPPIPAIARKITSDIKLDNGIVLPKNLNICLFIYGCHHNPKYFPEPEKFIPERFERDNIQPFTYMPFSAGPRNCIGKKFALLQMKSCISKIVRNFKLLPPKPDYELQLAVDVTLVSRTGIRVSLEKRIIE